MLPDLLRATLELGLPVAALSWLLFYRLYSRGELARDADRKAIHSSLKQIKGAARQSKQPSDSVLHTKWMRFGGGFYGVAALWTLLFIETSGIVSTIAHPSSLEAMFQGGLIDFVVGLFVNQFTTFIQALVWFSWWSGRGHQPFAWFVVAYLGYIAGLELARYETSLGTRVVGLDWRARVRSWFAAGNDEDD